MNRKSLALSLLTLWPLWAAACSSSPTAPSVSSPLGSGAPTASAAGAQGGRAGSSGVVYVTSQGLYFDTFVARDPLPMEGKFQRLTNGTTDFGPGDPGYLGGRWWEDLNGNGIQDAHDHFFLCPLLPPGRATP